MGREVKRGRRDEERGRSAEGRSGGTPRIFKTRVLCKGKALLAPSSARIIGLTSACSDMTGMSIHQNVMRRNREAVQPLSAGERLQPDPDVSAWFEGDNLHVNYRMLTKCAVELSLCERQTTCGESER